MGYKMGKVIDLPVITRLNLNPDRTLEVIVDSQIISNGKYSTNNDTLTMELT
jgi:hypothetical protein